MQETAAAYVPHYATVSPPLPSDASVITTEPVKTTASASAHASQQHQHQQQQQQQRNPQRIPKPALRFIRHVTYPDGTVITPGTTFTKTWRVRNDGNKAWPEGVTLIPAGGDSLCPEDTVLSLPGMQIDEEQEVHVTLQAPEKPGLYTQYFRARTREQQLFGHRLWVSVMVEGD